MSKKLSKCLALLLVLCFLLAIINPGVAVAVQNDVKQPGIQKLKGAYVEGELLVRFKEGTSVKGKAGTPGKVQAQVLNRDMPSAQRLKLAHGKSVNESLQEMMNDPNVLYVEPNYKMRAYESPGAAVSVNSVVYDTYYSDQWGLEAIDIENAWAAWEAAGSPDNRVILAVLDQGVDLAHPDLVNRILTGIDYDFIDDDNDAVLEDVYEFHGTHVAGIAAAEMNDTGIAGVAGPANVKILPVRVLDSEGIGTNWSVSQGIRWAADHGANIINMSLGGSDYSYTVAEAVAYAQGKGALVVAAAGNNGEQITDVYPATLPGVLTVTAVDRNLYSANFSNYGPEIEVAAPGVDILSTIPWESTGETGVKGYDSLSGTSMATPFVSGLAALIKAVHPDYSPSEITGIIQKTVSVPDG